MNLADVFVGTLCASIGVAALAIAAANWAPGFQFWVGRWVDGRFGRTASRVVYALAGAALIVLGIAIIRGFTLVEYLDL